MNKQIYIIHFDGKTENIIKEFGRRGLFLNEELHLFVNQNQSFLIGDIMPLEFPRDSDINNKHFIRKIMFKVSDIDYEYIWNRSGCYQEYICQAHIYVDCMSHKSFIERCEEELGYSQLRSKE